MRRSEVEVLAKLYAVGEVRIGELDGRSELVWARGAGTEAGLESILALVPTSRFYEIVRDDRLCPAGRLLPVERLPNVRWIPLREWLSVSVPSAALPGELPGTARLELVRNPSRRFREDCEEILLCRVEAFRELLLRAPAHRLSPLRFVLNEARGEVLVRGQPRPSVPATHYILEGGIATPAGYAWSPPVGVSVVRSWLGVRDNAFALWRSDGSLSEIADDAFAGASRRAGREL